MILAYILRGRQWLCRREWMRFPIFGYEIVGKWIGEYRAENAQDKSTKEKRHGVGHDLLVDRAEAYILPVEGGTVRSSEQDRADPVGRAEDRDHGPWIIEKGACHEREQIESQSPGADKHQNGVQSVERTKSDEDANGEGQRRSLRRLLEMKNLFQQCAK